MGAWGVGGYENDDAGDWLFGLDEVTDMGPIRAALTLSGTADHLEVREAAVALLAAELVAALAGVPAAVLPPDVRAWLSRVTPLAPSPDDVAAALAALALVAGDQSELAHLWAESDDALAWLEYTTELASRLRRITAIQPA